MRCSPCSTIIGLTGRAAQVNIAGKAGMTAKVGSTRGCS
jgi:hypothetical protein